MCVCVCVGGGVLHCYSATSHLFLYLTRHTICQAHDLLRPRPRRLVTSTSAQSGRGRRAGKAHGIHTQVSPTEQQNHQQVLLEHSNICGSEVTTFPTGATGTVATVPRTRGTYLNIDVPNGCSVFVFQASETQRLVTTCVVPIQFVPRPVSIPGAVMRPGNKSRRN